ncbi:hypothetical protein ABT330_14000 [Streptomyces sp. NPDC000658]|uniref:hypothetical protein n=1 Tax=Streptomyces sp. NPDC000658 TaxID=3154266 RepID=UPI00331830C6
MKRQDRRAFAAGQAVLMLIVDLRHRDRNLVAMTLGAPAHQLSATLGGPLWVASSQGAS